MSYLTGKVAGEEVRAGLESIAQSLDKIAKAATIAAEAYAKKVEAMAPVHVIKMQKELTPEDIERWKDWPSKEQ